MSLFTPEPEDFVPPKRAVAIISVPLIDYATALIGMREYSVIDDKTLRLFAQAADYSFYVIIENDANTESFTGEKLPQLKEGLYRLWIRSYFDKIEAGKRTRLARYAREANEREKMVVAVAGKLWEIMNKAVPYDLCLSSAKGMTLENLAATIKQHTIVVS